MLTTLLIVLTLLFTTTSTPLLMALLIISISVIMAVSMYLLSSYSWFSFILLMIFISGMMIIFVYISSLASNKLTPTNPMLAFILIMSSLLASISYNTSFSRNLLTQPQINSISLMTSDCSPHTIYKLYTPLITTLTILLMLYLLLALLVVVKTTSPMKGPLRAKM